MELAPLSASTWFGQRQRGLGECHSGRRWDIEITVHPLAGGGKQSESKWTGTSFTARTIAEMAFSFFRDCVATVRHDASLACRGARSPPLPVCGRKHAPTNSGRTRCSFWTSTPATASWHTARFVDYRRDDRPDNWSKRPRDLTLAVSRVQDMHHRYFPHADTWFFHYMVVATPQAPEVSPPLLVPPTPVAVCDGALFAN